MKIEMGLYNNELSVVSIVIITVFVGVIVSVVCELLYWLHSLWKA